VLKFILDKRQSMSDRAKDLMKKIWESRNSGADTEEKLVAQILRSFIEYVTLYNTQNDIQVLSTDDVINLANEVESLK
jgi:hypothetical protein